MRRVAYTRSYCLRDKKCARQFCVPARRLLYGGHNELGPWKSNPHNPEIAIIYQGVRTRINRDQSVIEVRVVGCFFLFTPRGVRGYHKCVCGLECKGERDQGG